MHSRHAQGAAAQLKVVVKLLFPLLLPFLLLFLLLKGATAVLAFTKTILAMDMAR